MPPGWVILSTAPLDVLRRAMELHEVSHRRWSVHAGGVAHHVIVGGAPPGEDGGEEELARDLSRGYPGRHYVLHLHPPWVGAYERGACVEEPAEAPGDLARRLGAPLEPHLG